MIRYNDIKVSQEEIELCKKEWFETKTYHGTDTPIVLDDKTAKRIINSIKYHEAFLNAVHSSHKMTEWKGKLLTPCDTTRMYSYRKCENCGGEHYYHAAGKFIDPELEKKCVQQGVT